MAFLGFSHDRLHPILGLTVVMVVSGVTATSVTATTAPGTVVEVPVLVDGPKITVKPDQFTLNGQTRFPRGAIVDFLVKNAGTEATSVQIAILGEVHFYGAGHIAKVTRAGAPIKPGKSKHFQVAFFFRGTFALESVSASHTIIAQHQIIVF